MTISDHKVDSSRHSLQEEQISTQAPNDQSQKRGKHQIHKGLALFALPAMLLIFIFFLLPFMLNVVFGFVTWTGYSSHLHWAGLGNFRYIWQLGILKHATEVTAVYAVIVMLIQNVVSLTLAVALQKTTFVNSVFRTVFFVPVLISSLAAGYIWEAMLQPDGALNRVLSFILPGHYSYAYLAHPFSALISVAAIDAWKWSGLITLVYIAGLNAIPRTVIEAATVDGAGPWRRFWGVKAPLLAPAFTFNVVVTFVGALSAFDIIMAVTSSTGGPGNATSVLNVALYQQYYLGFYGQSSALSLIITALVVFTAVPLVTWMRRREVAM